MDESKVLTTYKRYLLQVEPDTIFYNSHVRFTGNGKLETNRNLISIIVFDTTKFTIELYSKENNSLFGEKELHAVPNTYFNEDWKNIELGETPTPLTAKQLKAFDNFARYRLLNQNVPSFKAVTVTGDSISERNLHGKITVANFWYYGCIPCMEEIPTLNEISNHYRSDSNVQFLSFFRDSVFIDSTGVYYQSKVLTTDTMGMRPQKIDLDFTIIPNSKSIKESFNVFWFPTNIVIDENGVVRDIIVGSSKDRKHNVLESNIKRAIDKIKTTANKS